MFTFLHGLKSLLFTIHVSSKHINSENAFFLGSMKKNQNLLFFIEVIQIILKVMKYHPPFSSYFIYNPKLWMNLYPTCIF